MTALRPSRSKQEGCCDSCLFQEAVPNSRCFLCTDALCSKCGVRQHVLARHRCVTWVTVCERCSPGATWIPDTAYKQCMRCKVPFTFFRRRHHCRVCGWLLCGNCSTRRKAVEVDVPKSGIVEVRVCDDCLRSPKIHYQTNFAVSGGDSQIFSRGKIYPSQTPDSPNYSDNFPVDERIDSLYNANGDRVYEEVINSAPVLADNGSMHSMEST